MAKSKAKREPRAAQKRFRLVADDDGHYYAIPADKQREFEQWVLACNEACVYKGEDLSFYQLSQHYSSYTFERMLKDA